jgi:hypothetical protein
MHERPDISPAEYQDIEAFFNQYDGGFDEVYPTDGGPVQPSPVYNGLPEESWNDMRGVVNGHSVIAVPTPPMRERTMIHNPIDNAPVVGNNEVSVGPCPSPPLPPAPPPSPADALRALDMEEIPYLDWS